MRLKAGDRLDRFEILEPLGEGAYAETYKARDTKSGQMVLIKSPNPLLFADPGIHQRFMRESEIAKHLNHPGVQRSVDLGEKRSEPYLAMEYIDGDSLRRWLRSHKGPLTVPQTVKWAKELTDALSYLHKHNIVHRDLKPENIIVTNDGHLKIIDFGTALLAGARRLTWRHLTEALGTPDYMSPEQIQGERGDARSDLYSLGIMLYEFLTDRVPFEGDNWLAVMQGHLQRHPKPIREIRPEVPPELEAIVLTAMRRYPENRYQSADEMLADLNSLDLQDAKSPAAPGAASRTPAPSPAPSLAREPAPPVAAQTDAVRPAVPAYGAARGHVGGPSLPTGPRSVPTTGGGPSTGGGSPGVAPRPSPRPRAPVSAASRDLSPEKPIGRLPAPASQKGFWIYVWGVAGGFIAIVALVIVLTKLLQ
jgi:serine/threonine-protein kinase